jgi:hypothetical protein
VLVLRGGVRWTDRTSAAAGGFQGWRLCIARGGKSFTRYFSDKQYGSERKALKAAEYLRKHWFEVVTGEGWTMKIYFERQPGSGRRAGVGTRGGSRWRLFSTSGGTEPDCVPEDPGMGSHG